MNLRHSVPAAVVLASCLLGSLPANGSIRGAPGPAPGSPAGPPASIRLISPDAASEQDKPRIEVLSSNDQGVDLTFELPALAVEQLDFEGTSYQSLAIPGGGLEGEVGEPALPAFTRLLMIPDGAAVTVSAEAQEEEELSGYDLLPILDDEGGPFVRSAAAYAHEGYGDAPAAAAGAPALWRNLRIVPLTFRPVQYNPAQRTLKLAQRLRVHVAFSGDDATNARAGHKETVPSSYDRLYRDLVINYTGPEEGQRVDSGTWLVICSSDPTVVAGLQPLLTWRQRKGTPTVLVTTAVTTTNADSIKAYIQNAYDTWPNPPEYVVLAGDATGGYAIPTWYEDLSGYNGEGDLPYSLLEGSDYLPDVHVGRLSFGTLTELNVIVNKIVGYESTPFMQDFIWFRRACLVGDPNGSGYSTVQVMQWIKTRLRQLGYTPIDTVFTSPFVSQMSAALNQGDSFFSYRGYGGMSGWSNSNTYALTNTWRLPFAVISTCGTGSFASGTAISEGFLRAGTVSAPIGAVGASATATSGTHTRFNNCFVMGVSLGLFYENEYEMGVAMDRGRIELYLNYGQSSQAVWAHVFAHWNNLMGDPAAEVWTSQPVQQVSVTRPTTIPLGANSLRVTVSAWGVPVDGAQVCAWKGTETYTVGRTDSEGDCELPLTPATAGDLLLTVSKHNYVPFRATVPVGAQPLFVGYQASTVDDDGAGESQGNGDGLINPGETIELPVQLHNSGTMNATGVTATLTSEDPYVTLTDTAETFGNIPAGGSAWSADDFGFTVSPGCPDGHILRFGLDATDGTNQWHSLIDLPATSADLVATGMTLQGDDNGILDPGESGLLSIPVRNDGSADAAGASAVLVSLSPWVLVLDSLATYGDIPVGAEAENAGDPFHVSASDRAYPGHLAVFRVITRFNGGATDTSEVTLTVGTRASTDPIGPDGYGYYGFDDTDADFPGGPGGGWVEIDPAFGGSGTQVILGDYGDYQDKSLTVDLPFPFRYYGQDFEQATICSNGWIAMGQTYLTDYRNWTIPGVGAPQNMLAVFWDDLQETSSGGHVYRQYDAANHRWIVEWSRMVNAVGLAGETFEAILYDPQYYPTQTGDGIIVYQYSDVSNVDSVDEYATVGIENWDHTDGLLYTYFNAYPAGAAPLMAGRSIRFLPLLPQPEGVLQGHAWNESFEDAPIQGVTVRLLETGRTFVTGPDGLYGGQVSGGTYTVTASHPSFAPDTVRNVVVSPSGTTVVDFHLVDIGGPTIDDVSELGPSVSGPGPYPIQATILDASTVASAAVVYRVDESAWVESPMTLSGGDVYAADIPALPPGLVVDYYITARDGHGYDSSFPPGAPDSSITFYRTDPVYTTACEDPGDPDWQLGVAGDAATTGIWIRDDPVGTIYNGQPVQPEDDHTVDPGVKCFVTGNGTPGGDAGENDVDGGCTTLQSPPFDLSQATQAFLTYWRWYGEGGNSTDDEFAVDVSSDGGTSWTPLERVPDNAASWTEVSVDLSTRIALTDQVVVRFVACDLNTGGLVEAAIDDLTLDAFVPIPTGLSGPQAPAIFQLGRIRPNPFGRETEILYSLPRAGEVSLVLYNVQGRIVRTLVDGPVQAGSHAVFWDGLDGSGLRVASGIYFARLRYGNESAVRKVIRVD